MKEYNISSGFLNRERKLILTEDYIEYENRDLKREKFTRLNKSEIIDFRHGMDWIIWYKFNVGRQFSITLKDNKNEEFRILFDNYFGLHKENNHVYPDIVENVWKFYHSDIVDVYLDKFYNDEELEIQGIKLKQEGIRLRGQSSILTWDKISIKEYYRYFTIYQIDNPNLHSWVSFNQYGTETLWSLLRTIKKEKEINVSQNNV